MKSHNGINYLRYLIIIFFLLIIIHIVSHVIVYKLNPISIGIISNLEKTSQYSIIVEAMLIVVLVLIDIIRKKIRLGQKRPPFAKEKKRMQHLTIKPNNGSRYLKYTIITLFAILIIHISFDIIAYELNLISTPVLLRFQTTSEYIMIGEAVLFVILISIRIINKKIKRKPEPKGISPIEVREEEKKPGIHTDLDILYKMLKEKKRIPISKIAKAFNINKETALDWSKTLETAELAEIQYSALKEEVLTIKENEEKKV